MCLAILILLTAFADIRVEIMGYDNYLPATVLCKFVLSLKGDSSLKSDKLI